MIQIKKTTLLLFISAALIFQLFHADISAQSYSITVSAGELDRMESPVSFYFPEAVEPGVYRIQSSDGDSHTLQVDDQNRGWFLLSELSAGESRTYQFSGEQADESSSVSKNIDSNTITFQAGGSDVISYFHGMNEPPEVLDERYQRGGYIHPVLSPGGTVLSNHLNPDGHPHHSGIWSAWPHTEFEGRTPDFWNVHQNSGRVDQQDSLDVAWDGPVHAGFRAKHYFVDLSTSNPVIALNEEWEVRVYPSARGENVHMFDLRVIQTANTDQPLHLPEYRYGGVGFRGHVDWDDPDNATFLTSDGLGRDGHATRVRWTHIGGHSEGELAGISIMSHPENVRHPQPVRIHPNEPFFNYAPVQMGDMIIEAGSPYTAKYRFITYDGEPDTDLIEAVWNDYAYPPGVTVTKNNDE
ncbi:hypothetical protein DYD21_17370 [Rhodohalobacter sp. SW132]|uniref:DUF6807 domain-containing protein n=1 Tax=Rhodohalobacter sp. SW132 TaxID=2293433 RepID=UPI000E2372AD|nr:PmoA family protein [Rhodohalobacter sp. SW132]REL24633.1 hypothetical protein DYD21_17370 [Rhodohalobacter sp. SW132]